MSDFGGNYGRAPLEWEDRDQFDDEESFKIYKRIHDYLSLGLGEGPSQSAAAFVARRRAENRVARAEDGVKAAERHLNVARATLDEAEAYLASL
jgi:hypothetical protein